MIPDPQNLGPWIESAHTALECLKTVKDLIPKGAKRDEAERSLQEAEDALKRSDAKLAGELEFELCHRHWPPGIMIRDWKNRSVCNICQKEYSPPATFELEVEFLKHLRWQWMSSPDTCREALEHLNLDALKTGQEHEPKYQKVYDDAHRAYDVHEFWQLVATASYLKPNFSGCAEHLSWQLQNDRESMVRACYFWKQRIKGLEPKNNYIALSALLYGQRHNRDVMSLYRACYRSNGEELYRQVEKCLQS